MRVKWTAAVYIRLSREDGDKSESYSVSSQRAILGEYLKLHPDIELFDYYIDDGWSGTTFDRPDFNRMMQDIYSGNVNCVIVKDLSRFGRNYSDAGNYLDNIFVRLKVRFISLNNGIDTASDSMNAATQCISVGVTNVINESLAATTSVNVRGTLNVNRMQGKFIGSFATYGYMKDPNNKKKWIVDTEAAEVVKSIFAMCIEGKGNETIARILQENKVMIPMAYWQSKGLNKGGKKTQPDPYKWCKTTVQKILVQQEYCGDVINFKTYSKNFKNKKRLMNAEENWRIFKDVHEPIIEREEFELVQENLLKVKRRAPKPENAKKHIFSGLIRCGDCGSNMRYHTNTTNKEIHYFSCGNYIKDTRGDCPTRHYIRSDALEQIVLLELKNLANFLKYDEERLAEILERKSNKDLYKETRYLEGELQKALARQQKVANLYEKLYEDNAEGKVTDEWFTHMSHKYEVERTELKGKVSELRKKLSSTQETTKGKDMFLNAVRSFIEMETLTAPLAKELIDHIDVYEAEGKGKNKTQRIVIYYRFVGYIELPDKIPIVNDTRQGVAVNYISGALPETA